MFTVPFTQVQVGFPLIPVPKSSSLILSSFFLFFLQGLNAVLINRLGIGPSSIQGSQLNQKNFSIALRRATTERNLKVRAEVFGEHLRREKGGLRTLAFIAEHFKKYFKIRGLPVPDLKAGGRAAGSGEDQPPANNPHENQLQADEEGIEDDDGAGDEDDDY